MTTIGDKKMSEEMKDEKSKGNKVQGATGFFNSNSKEKPVDEVKIHNNNKVKEFK